MLFLLLRPVRISFSSDFVTLHVPGAEDTTNMIGAPQLALMKQGSFLLNLSRGHVVRLLVFSFLSSLASPHLLE